MIKTQYEYVIREGIISLGNLRYYQAPGIGELLVHPRFQKRWGGMFRRMRTQQERRRNAGDRTDYGYQGRRKSIPSAWDDIPYSRLGGKSWKDYTRHRRQWMKNL